MMSEKVVLVTGASSGIGYEAALELKENGFIVYGAASYLSLYLFCCNKLSSLESLTVYTLG